DMRELGAETQLETCLTQARQIGFEGMELGHKFPRDARELAATLGRFGLACVSGWYSAQLLARDVRSELTCLRAHFDWFTDVIVYRSTGASRATFSIKNRENTRQGSTSPGVRAGEGRGLELPARRARGRVHRSRRRQCRLRARDP